MRIPYRKPGKFSQVQADLLMTEAKFAKLQNQLAHLKKIQPTAAREVSRLAEMGDFSENAEYQLAKGRLRGILQNILRLEKQLDHAVLIAPEKTTGIVALGHHVTIENTKEKRTYQILGSAETAPAQGIISHLSPIGVALMGKKVGEKIKIKLVNTDVEYTIIQIE